MITAWGLLGPESLVSERRTRTLGLGATVRAFNDFAVPGLGGVWFGKQLFLATLGVAVAEKVRSTGKQVQNIEVANAIEALACWLALNGNGWKSDPRLNGAQKMRNQTDLAFSRVRRPGFYVTQPMRQATVQPLLAFGLVESSGERFNGFTCSKIGFELIEAACADLRPHKRGVLDHLVGWARGIHDDVTNSNGLTQALSPLNSLPKPAREFLRDRLIRGHRDSTGVANNSRRRSSALSWIDRLRADPQTSVDWESRPPELETDHWHDLQSGALFFKTRDAAIVLLDAIEAEISNRVDQKLSLKATFPKVVADRIALLSVYAQDFLEFKYDPSPAKIATAFCRECATDGKVRLVEHLLAREGRVLRQIGSDVVPGVAFRGGQAFSPTAARSPEEAGNEQEVETDVRLPDGISRRVRNLFLLNLDLHGELSSWLSTGNDGAGVGNG